MPPILSKARDTRQATSRMRSGSGTSRTTATSDSGELDSNGLVPGQVGQSSLSASSSPSQPSAASNFFHIHHNSPHVSSASGAGTFSAPGGIPHGTGLNPPSANPASALSPIATRMRERDADAMEKYMRRNRSESQGTSSTDTGSNYASAGPSANGDNITSLAHIPISGSTTPRLLRPSISAAQLRTTPESLTTVTTQPQPESRNRSGTNPTATRPTLVLNR